MGTWKLTVRDGSEVSHQLFDDLGEAVAAMRERAMAIRAEGPVEGSKVLQRFTPEKQVRARLQLSGKGWLRKPTAGVDVRGDGTFMPFSGGVGREELDPTAYDSPFDLVRETLEDGGD